MSSYITRLQEQEEEEKKERKIKRNEGQVEN
jgi:hypothetical protein